MDPKLMCLCFIMIVVVCKAQPIDVKAVVLSPSLHGEFTSDGDHKSNANRNKKVSFATRRKGGLIDAPCNVDPCPPGQKLNADCVCREPWYVDPNEKRED